MDGEAIGAAAAAIVAIVDMTTLRDTRVQGSGEVLGESFVPDGRSAVAIGINEWLTTLLGSGAQICATAMEGLSPPLGGRIGRRRFMTYARW